MEAGAYVDDVLAQRVYVNAAGASSPTPTLLYHVRDANHNVVALTDDRGNPVARYGYTPFGVPRWAEVVATESIEDNQTPKPTSTSIAAARLNRIGHQGLMIERVDTPWGAPMGVDDSAGGGGAGSTLESRGLVSASARFLYHNRNRLYNPAQGRFLGRDPNGLGGPVMEGLVFGGRAVGVPERSFDVTRHTGDGINTQSAYGGNPLKSSDASGLDFDIGSTLQTSTIEAGLGNSQLGAIAGFQGGGTAAFATGESFATAGGLGFGFGGAIASGGGLSIGAKIVVWGLVGVTAAGSGSVLWFAGRGELPYQPDRPRYLKNPKHDDKGGTIRLPNNVTPEPDDAEMVYNRSITIDGGRTWWGLNGSTQVYRFGGDGGQGEKHFNGATGTNVREQYLTVPPRVWKFFGQSGPPPQ